jgi:pyridoxine kinase
MPTILSLSSQVAYGHVGHSAAVFAWQRLGFEVVALPTVILSNRPGYPHINGLRIPPETLNSMLEALDANGSLEGIGAVFTGYMPTAEHADVAGEWIAKLKARKAGLIHACDPILGDEPHGLYIAEDAAAAIRDRLVPLADIVMPNCFELGWLTGTLVRTAAGAAEAASKLTAAVLATSVPAESSAELVNLLHTCEGRWQTAVARRPAVAHGSGDLMAALFLAQYLRLGSLPDALALATAGLEAAIDASEGAAELRLIESQDRWAAPAPWPLAATRTTD